MYARGMITAALLWKESVEVIWACDKDVSATPPSGRSLGTLGEHGRPDWSDYEVHRAWEHLGIPQGYMCSRLLISPMQSSL